MEHILKMKNIWKTDLENFESSACVVDGSLILTLPNAINPVVWRMELGNVKTSALEVRNSSDGYYNLILKTPKGDVHDIAPFENKEAAVSALIKVSNALKNAPKTERDVQTQNIENNKFIDSKKTFLKPDEGAIKWLVALAGVIFVVFLYAYIAKTSPNIQMNDIPGQETATTIDGNITSESGVPQSANDLLKGF